ncbi:MAG: flagellar filament capping protein FliD [Cellvibrionaceae bacterium]
MIQNIVNTLGGGSGIDTLSLVDQLVELQAAPETQRLDTKEELLGVQISDFGLLRSSLGKLETAVGALSNSDTFDAKSLSIPDTSLIALTKLDSKAVSGSYQIKIEDVAQAQSLSSAIYASEDAAVGTGSLTIRFGDWNGALDTFAVNAERTGATIDIDDTNNSLQGLRDAINDADIGVQASIVSDGGSYRLMVTGPSGASNELEIVAAEGASPGLASFDFNEASQSLTQELEGKDAQIRLNGLLVSRPSNTITDLVDGLEFDIFNSSPTEVINLSISHDKEIAETAIRDFVDAYNLFLEEVEVLTGFDSELGDFGSLKNDSMADNLINNVRRFMGAEVPGIGEGFTVLANLGIRTQLDGSLEINEDPSESNTNFRAAMDTNFDLVKELFTPQFNSSDSKIEVTGSGKKTQPGTYDVVITQEATQGILNGAAFGVGFPIDTTGKDYSFDITVDGQTASITLPSAKTYTTGEELAAEIQSLINLDATLQENRISLSATFNSGSGGLDFTSDSFGSSSVVNISAIGADAGEIGLSVVDGTAGVNVEGTIDGKEAFGFGNVLLPTIGSPAEGLKMIIKPGATTGSITFSQGFSGGMTRLMDSFLASNGLISEREKNINESLDDIDEDRASLERRTEAFRSRMESQFLAMELIVRSLNNTGTFLDGIGDRLPFTAPR